jgi:hypothetical protein
MKHMYGTVDLSEFNFDNLNEWIEQGEQLIKQVAAEAVQYAMTDVDSETYAYFPIEWNSHDGNRGKAPEDPTTIYFCVDLSVVDGDKPVWQTTLREMLSDTIKACHDDSSYAEGLKKLSAGLKELVAEIDDAITVGTGERQRPAS